MLVISTQNWSILAKFAKKIQRNRLIFTWQSSPPPPPKFPVKPAEFSENLPLKILWNLTFFLWNPAKSADFCANFNFSPAKIPRNRLIFPRICPKILLSFLRNMRSPDYMQVTMDFLSSYNFLTPYTAVPQGASLAEQLERWTCNSEALSSSPALTASWICFH